MMDGGIFFSLEKGPPGMAFIMKNVMLVIKKSEMRMVAARLSRKRDTGYHLPGKVLHGKKGYT
jgi:hypothetical protein